MDQSQAQQLHERFNTIAQILRELGKAHEELFDLLIPEIDHLLHQQIPHNDAPK